MAKNIKLEKKIENFKERYLSYYNKGLGDREIAEIFNVNRRTIESYRNKYGLRPNKRSPITDQLDAILNLYNNNISDANISKALNCSSSGVSKIRRKLDLPVNIQNRVSEAETRIILELQQLNFTNNEIAFYTNKSLDAINLILPQNLIGDELKYDKETPLTERELSIIIGIMLGDGHMSCRKLNASFYTEHAPKQKLYTIEVAKQLQRLHPKLGHTVGKTVDTRTNKTYDKYWVAFPALEMFTSLYKKFYINNLKVIPEDLLPYYTAESLAYQFMDDGTKMDCSYKIATNCFQIKELEMFQYFLLTKFNLHTTLHKDRGIYIRSKDSQLFKDLVSPYICECMRYKLHN